MTFALRWIVLQTVLAAGVYTAYLAGLASLPFRGINAYLVAAMLTISGVGLVMILLKRWQDAQWIATHILRLGLLGTVVGLLMAFAAAGTANTSDPDSIRTLLLHVIDGMFLALWLTFCGVASNIWLRLNIWLLNGHAQ